MATVDEWRWTDENGIQRVVREDELRSALASNVLAPSTLVWREGMTDWVPAFTIPELGVSPAGALTDATTTDASRPPSHLESASANGAQPPAFAIPPAPARPAPAPAPVAGSRGNRRTVTEVLEDSTAGAEGPVLLGRPKSEPPRPRSEPPRPAIVPRAGATRVPRAESTNLTGFSKVAPPPRAVAPSTWKRSPDGAKKADDELTLVAEGKAEPFRVKAPSDYKAGSGGAEPSVGAQKRMAPAIQGKRPLTKTEVLPDHADPGAAKQPATQPPPASPAASGPRANPYKTTAAYGTVGSSSAASSHLSEATGNLGHAMSVADSTSESTGVLPLSGGYTAEPPAIPAAPYIDASAGVAQPRAPQPAAAVTSYPPVPLFPAALIPTNGDPSRPLSAADWQVPRAPALSEPQPPPRAPHLSQPPQAANPSQASLPHITKHPSLPPARPNHPSQPPPGERWGAAAHPSQTPPPLGAPRVPQFSSAPPDRSLTPPPGETGALPLVSPKRSIPPASDEARPQKASDPVTVPMSSLFTAGAILVGMVVAGFFVGRCSMGAAVAPAQARPVLAALPRLARATVPEPLKPCWMARQPVRWAPAVTQSIPFDVAPISGGFAVAYARDPREAVQVRVVAATGVFEEKAAEKREADVVRVVVERGGNLGMLIATTADETTFSPFTFAPSTPSFVIGTQGRGSASVTLAAAQKPDGSPETLWSLPPIEKDKGSEALRVLLASPGKQALVFRRGGGVFGGWVSGDRKPLGELTAIAGSGGSVGKPMLSENRAEIAVTFADQASNGSPWEIRVGRAAFGQMPTSTTVIPLPKGGPGGDAFAPDIAGLPDGRWMLVWTEGPIGSRAVRAQTFDSALQPLGDPIAISPPAGNFGQGILAVSEGYVSVVFLSKGASAYELWGAVLQCS